MLVHGAQHARNVLLRQPGGAEVAQRALGRLGGARQLRGDVAEPVGRRHGGKLRQRGAQAVGERLQPLAQRRDRRRMEPAADDLECLERRQQRRPQSGQALDEQRIGLGHRVGTIARVEKIEEFHRGGAETRRISTKVPRGARTELPMEQVSDLGTLASRARDLRASAVKNSSNQSA